MILGRYLRVVTMVEQYQSKNCKKNKSAASLQLRFWNSDRKN